MEKMIKYSNQFVTPAMASAWLEVAHDNRTIKGRSMRGLAASIKAGRFVLTHQGIAFDAGGRLIDGEHRLRAIVLADAGAWLSVAEYQSDTLAHEARAVLDSGAKRSLGDQLELLKELPDHGTERVAVARLIMLIEIGHWDSRTDLRNERGIAIEFMADHSAIRERMSSTLSAVQIVPFVWAREVAPERIDALAVKLTSGVGLDETEATLLLMLQRKIPGGANDRVGHALKLLRLIEAHLNGERLTRVQEQVRGSLVERFIARKASAAK